MLLNATGKNQTPSIYAVEWNRNAYDVLFQNETSSGI